jgi:hypothetical protein
MRVFSVTVSKDQKMTSVMVAYSLNSGLCLGPIAYTSTSAPVEMSESGRPAFTFTRAVYGTDGGYVEITGEFTSTDAAVGTARFRKYHECGDGDFTWSATRVASQDIPFNQTAGR